MGRRKIGASEHADREMASFLAVGPDSHYFGEQWPNMKRCLRRYIEQAQVEVKKVSYEDKEEAEANEDPEEDGFAFNPHDSCVCNKTEKGKQGQVIEKM